jgi:hypothetical protein
MPTQRVARFLYKRCRAKKTTQNGQLEIDNNPIENSIRPIAVGRKNYLFASSHDSAQRAAVAYTILAACKTANVNSVEYLADVLQKLPTRNVNDTEDLLPIQWAENTSMLSFSLESGLRIR